MVKKIKRNNEFDFYFTEPPKNKNNDYICHNPKCNGKTVMLFKGRYNDLCPEALAGSAGFEYLCPRCGFIYQEKHIVS